MSRTLGIDLGTSGVRAVVLEDDGTVASAAVPIPDGRRRDPAALWSAVAAVLDALALDGVLALAVDGTSGTILPVGADGAALGPLLLYSDVGDPAAVAVVARAAPAGNAARGATSPLARALGLRDVPGLARVLHEADWIAGLLCGRFDATDANNALKTGYDPVAQAWPDWLNAAGMPRALLPDVSAPGDILGEVTAAMARRFGLGTGTRVAAGTTDGCASFLAAGATAPGDAVTALGSTLTLKLGTAVPISSGGVYSHRLLGNWVAGGSSNAGGAALVQFFSPAELTALSRRIDPATDSGCDFYPLPAPGERFPVNDPTLAPRMTPRPADDARFLHGLLEGIARIEAEGYRLLTALGGPPVSRVLTVGGGAANPTWTAIRARVLGVPVLRGMSGEAAHGAALLARIALNG